MEPAASARNATESASLTQVWPRSVPKNVGPPPISPTSSRNPQDGRSSLVAIDGLETPVAPGSTLAAVALVNELKAQTARRLVERDAMPPVITSAAVVGREESTRLFDAAYADHARRYARALRGAEID